MEFSEKIQLHFVLLLWRRVIGHPYIGSAIALSDISESRLEVLSYIMYLEVEDALKLSLPVDPQVDRVVYDLACTYLELELS